MADSPLLDQLVDALCCMPGIGRKSAQRIAFHLLERNRDGAKKMSRLLEEAMEKIGHCKQCRTFTENELCHICSNPKRDDSLLCVVESPADVAAIEQTDYRGKYFVLMGHLSPLDGIGPEEIGLNILKQRLEQGEIKEVILATNTTVEGEATAHFINDMVIARGLKATRIAHGVPMGGELEYVNATTITHALAGRKAL